MKDRALSVKQGFHQRLKQFNQFELSPWMIPLAMLLVTFITYGLLFSQLGFYWDDQPMSWIRYQIGTDAMRVYFSTSRPVWGVLYQITTRLLPHVPIYWQLFALFWRWVTVVLCWGVLQALWPNRRRFALVGSLFFLLYPGFNLQWVSYLISHFFIVLSFFLFSFLLMLWSLRYPRRYWLLTILALIFSALNVWMMEYFFFLELIRPIVIYFFLKENPSTPKSGTRRLIFTTLLKWSPYLAIWVADVLYRTLVFTNLAYKNSLLSDLRAQPLAAGLALIQSVFSDLWLVSVQAWQQVFSFPNPSTDGLLTSFYYLAVVLLVGVLVAFLLWHIRSDEPQPLARRALWPIGLGLVALLAAGGPYWLANLPLSLSFPASRYTISFMLGASLLLLGVLQLFPTKIRLFVAVLLLALAAGRQAWWADSYRRDWTTQKSMFWQMFWRAPGLAPDTIVLLNQGPLNYFADNSLGAPLNWIYDPNNHSELINYVLFFPTSRVAGSLPGFSPGLPVIYNYLIAKFVGNTSQVVAFYYKPPGCLRVLDPEIDPQNHLIPDASLMRDAARLSSTAWILPDPKASMPEIYYPEPLHGWCYYFEQADLARQLGDWQRIAGLGEAAFNLSDHPNDPVERFVFIEGYAHTGDWAKVRELSLISYKVSPNFVGPLLCRLLIRIDRTTPSSSDKQTSLDDLRTKFSCLP
jgi:hypothetical protein